MRNPLHNLTEALGNELETTWDLLAALLPAALLALALA